MDPPLESWLRAALGSDPFWEFHHVSKMAQRGHLTSRSGRVRGAVPFQEAREGFFAPLGTAREEECFSAHR